PDLAEAAAAQRCDKAIPRDRLPVGFLRDWHDLSRRLHLCARARPAGPKRSPPLCTTLAQAVPLVQFSVHTSTRVPKWGRVSPLLPHFELLLTQVSLSAHHLLDNLLAQGAYVPVVRRWGPPSSVFHTRSGLGRGERAFP